MHSLYFFFYFLFTSSYKKSTSSSSISPLLSQQSISRMNLAMELTISSLPTHKVKGHTDKISRLDNTQLLCNSQRSYDSPIDRLVKYQIILSRKCTSSNQNTTKTIKKLEIILKKKTSQHSELTQVDLSFDCKTRGSSRY